MHDRNPDTPGIAQNLGTSVDCGTDTGERLRLGWRKRRTGNDRQLKIVEDQGRRSELESVCSGHPLPPVGAEM
jgi:hypothetical protein